MSLECWQEIINDYEKLFETDEGYDVIIYAGENENIKELHALSNILCIRSQYFRTAFSSEWAKKKDGKFIFEKPNISPDIFKIILKFIYCGKIDFRKFEGLELLKILMAADELNVQSLLPHIEEYLIKHHYEFLKKNPMEIIETTCQNESFKNLQDFCLEEVCKEPEVLFNSDKFISLKAPILELLLKRDDLCLEEVYIWDSLMKWAFAQHPTIPKDFTKWNKEEVTIMERTLNKHIPLIRFYCLSSEDFLDKVHPLKQLLPEDLINSLLTFYLAPNRRANIDNHLPRRHNKYNSVIIKFSNFAALFANWIDKKNDSSSRTIPYSFNLLYRASMDGNTIPKFHEKTDNQGANIFIAKIKGTDRIIGGYNPFDWSGSNCWKRTFNSFIFTFKDYKDINTAKIGNVIDAQYAVYGSHSCGPVFGSYNMHTASCDITLQNSNDGIKWSSYPVSYPDIGIPRNFEVEDYEVFQVVGQDLLIFE